VDGLEKKSTLMAEDIYSKKAFTLILDQCGNMSHALLWIQGKMVHEHLLLVTSVIVVWQMMFLVWQTVSGLICSTGFSSTINSISTLVWYLWTYFLCKHLLLFSYKTLSKLSSGWPQKVYIFNTPCPWNRSRFHQNVPKAKLFWDNFVSHVPIFVTFHFCDQECFADKSIDFFSATHKKLWK